MPCGNMHLSALVCLSIFTGSQLNVDPLLHLPMYVVFVRVIKDFA